MATGGVLSPSSREIWHQRWRRRRRQDLVFKPSVEDARILPDSTGRLDDEIGSQNVLDFWGGVQRFCWTQQIYRSNKFLDPICFWMQALFRPNMFFWIRAIFWIQESFGTKAFKDLWIPTFQSGDIRKSSTLSLSTCRRCGQRRCRRCRQRRCRRCCRYVGQWPIIVVMWADGPE